MLPERSDRTIYLRVLGPLVLAVGTLLVVGVGGFWALSAARAYVGGESLWSKARSQTVAGLRAHVSGRAPVCQPLSQALAVPIGDRAARLAMERSPPDLAAARDGFLRGGNSPDDVDGLIDLYRYFAWTPMLQPPIEAWRKGDELVERLRVLGERLCAEPVIDQSSPASRQLVEELDQIDAALVDAEKRFSASLGEASRLTGQLLTAAIVLIGLLLAAGSTWYVLRSLRAQLEQRRALVDANTRWELAAGAAAVGLFVWHPDTDALELDARARHLHGMDAMPSEMIDRRALQARMHPDDREPFDRLQRAALERDQTLRARYRVVLDDGSTRHLEVVGTLRNGAPQAPQMFGVLRDVTDEVAAARLQLERDAAERSARARSEFLSRLSHELRTPLNAVLGLAQLLDLDRGEPLTEAQRARVRMILNSGWHLLNLVDDVLDITRIDAGQLAINLAPTDLRATLRASLALIETERARFGIQIDDRWPAAPPAALADPQRLQQVFVNLLSNACKYNRLGGTLTLTLQEEDAAMLALGFADEGRGIDLAQLAELFQPFKRLNQSADAPGTGLGLVIVRLLADQMQGSVEVTSEPGRGTRFTVRLRKA